MALLKTKGFDENENQSYHFRTIKQVFETVQPHQVNGFIADLHSLLMKYSEAKAKNPALKFNGLRWKPDN